MYAREIVDGFLNALVETPGAHRAYLSNPKWTMIATAALVQVAQDSFTGPKIRVAARGFKDTLYGRSEYLTLDVCAYDDATWGSPLLVAEHENSADVAKVQYCAWKLLVTEASRRVLVAYFASKVKFEGLVAAVREVAAANPGREAPRDLLLIAAPWDARPASNDALRELFQSHVIGEMKR